VWTLVAIVATNPVAAAEGPPAPVEATAGSVAVDPAVAEAIAVVERFSTAIAAGRIDQAATDLAPDLIVLESGGIEQTRDEYLSGHAAADAEFLKNADVTLKHRRAQASGDLAWVASESRIELPKGTETTQIDSTETIVLRRSTAGWKIVHIHWSSRRAPGP
jgi:ketosteroid isomerase-like protein